MKNVINIPLIAAGFFINLKKKEKNKKVI